jgi:hypothetical protein
VSGPVFIFCATGLVFDGTEGISSRFQVLRALARFRRYRGRRVSLSCSALPNSFSAAELRASGPVFLFCAPKHIFGDPEGGGYHFHVLSRASGPVFMFCAPGHVFDGMESVGTSFHVLRSRCRFRRYRENRVTFCVAGFIFGGTVVVGSRFQILRARKHFRRYRGHPVPFSCFSLPDMFFTVPSSSGPVFMFCAHEIIFGGLEGDMFNFHVLHAWTNFWRYRGRRVPFSCFCSRTCFLRCLVRRVPL